MASIRSYKNGAGGSSGADLAVLKPTFASGNYWYVGNAFPGASDANGGTERSKPLLTTAAAYANASAGDTLVFLAGHNENVGTSVVLGKAGLSLLGEGTGTLVPRFTATASIFLFDVTTAGVVLDNLYFPASTASTNARVRVGAAGSKLNALQFDCGVNDTGNSMVYIAGGDNGRLTNTRFTAVAAGALTGLGSTATVADLTIDTLTLDGGAFGWSSGTAWNIAAAATRLRATRVYQLNGSHIVAATGTTGTIQVAAATGDSRIDWTP